jgi:DNA-binding CsgD family transcriptional regulator
MLFIDNKYTKCYFSIITNATARVIPTEYTESHHIIPKCLGGTNSNDNLVRLTAREHFMCHRLLVKMTTGDSKRKLSYALWAIVNQENKAQRRHKVNSRTYAILREEHKRIHSIAQTGRVGNNTGKKFSEETKRKMSESAKKRGVSPQARLAAISACKGRIPWNKGKSIPEETKEKIRQGMLKRFSSED